MAIIETHFGCIADIFRQAGVCRPMLVCGKTVQKRLTAEQRCAIPANAVLFDGFSPNPVYEDIMNGVALFRENHCDSLISIGGGSAMDVAKCIQLYSKMPADAFCLEYPLRDTDVFHLAIPTTAGTGSEATRFAVIYYDGVKQSVHHDSIIPQAVILEPKLLETLPTYQRKATVMDALCQAIESIWSVHSTEESVAYAEKAIAMLLPNIDAYVNGDNSVIADMLMGSHLAGKAINITQTTAPHAMSYKLTTLFGIAHGHAVALCMQGVWAHMAAHPELCQDARGQAAVETALERLDRLFGAETATEAAEKFSALVRSLEWDIPSPTAEQLVALVDAVNVSRLNNHPVKLDRDAIEQIYRTVLR